MKTPTQMSLSAASATVTLLSLLVVLLTTNGSNAFTIHSGNSNAMNVRSYYNTAKTTTTQLNLKDSIADMIDKELLRLEHKKEIEQLHQINTEKVLEKTLPTNYNANEDFETLPQSVQYKDLHLALHHPDQYCADRCVATGYCDVFEDMYEMSAVEVLEFCTECVLSENEEPCDVPDAMFEGLSP